MATQRISVRVDESLRRKLEEASSSSGKKESHLIREALESYLKTSGCRDSSFDVAQRIGVIGIIKNAPTDLSTNRKYFKSFGRK